MQTTPLSKCKVTWLPLNALKSHPSLPAYSFAGQVISGWNSEVDEAIVPENVDLAGALHALHPQLSFVELARMRASMKLDNSTAAKIFETFGFRFNHQAEKIADLVTYLPEDFLKWADEKGFGQRDLAVLIPLKNLSAFRPIFATITENKLSNNHGRQALRLCSELVLLDHSADSIAKKDSESPAQWIERLQGIRYPKSSERDADLKTKVGQTLAPPHVDAQWLRKGDLTGLQLGFFCVSSSELESRLNALQKYQGRLAENLGELWTR